MPVAAPSVDADWHFKMCKKIAQLTKVVYTLNCRNEDNDERTEWLKKCHKEEIQRLVEECSRRVTLSNNKVKEVENDKHKAVSQIESKHKTIIDDMRTTFTEKVQKLSVKAENAAKQYEAQLKEMNEKNKKALEDEISRLRKTKDTELEALVVQYNDKYKAMLAEQMDARDALEKRLREERAREVQTIADQLAETQKMLSAQLEGRGKALQDAMHQNTSLAAEVAALTNKLNNAESSAKRLESDNAALKQQLASERSKLEELERSDEKLRDDLRSLQESFAAQAAQLEEASQSLQSAERKIQKLTSACTAAENEKSAMETMKNSAENELAALREEHAVVCAKLAELEASMKAVSSSAEGQQSQMKELRAALDAASAERAALEAQYKQSLDELTKAHQDALNQAKEISDRYGETALQKLRDEKASMEAELRQQLANSQKDAADKMEKALREHQLTIDNLTAQLEASKSDRGNADAVLEELRAAQRKLEEELGASQAQCAALKSEAEQRTADHAQVVSRLEEEIRLLQAKIDETTSAQRLAAEAADADGKAQAESLRQRHAEEQQKLREQLESQLERERREHMQQLESEKQKHAAAMRDAVASANRIASDAASDASRELSKVHEAAEAKLRLERERAEANERQLRLRIEDLEQQLRSLQMQLASEKESGASKSGEKDARIGELNAALTSATEAHRRALAELEAAAAKRLEEYKAQVTQSHAQELEALRQSMGSATDAHRMELDALKKSHADMALAEEKRHRQQMDAYKLQMQNDSAEQIENLTAMHNVKMKELQLRADESVAHLQYKLGKSSEESDALKRQVDGLKADMERLHAELDSIKRQAEQSRLSAEEQRSQLVASHSNAMQQMEADHSSVLNRLAAEHKRIADDFSRQSAEERQAHQAVLDDWRARYEDLEHKYKFRESRPEDVALINQLLQEKNDLNKALEKAYEDMKMYKLELINREENYNKLFGRRPVVAAAAPLPSTPAEKGGSRSLPNIHARSAAAAPHK